MKYNKCAGQRTRAVVLGGILAGGAFLASSTARAQSCTVCNGTGGVRAVVNSTTVPASSNNAGFMIQSSGASTWSLAGFGAQNSNTFTIFNDRFGSYAITIQPTASGGFAANSVTFFGDLRPSAAGTRQVGTSTVWFQQMAANNFLTMSDRRLKTDIQPLKSGIDTIKKLKPVRFKWKEDSKSDEAFGLIAQDVREVLPNLVDSGETPDSRLAVNYTELIPVLIKSVQDQQILIERQAAQIARLEKTRLSALGDVGAGTMLAAIPLGLGMIWQLRRRKQDGVS